MGRTGYGRSASQHAVVGRDKELTDLTGLARQTTAGQGHLILIEGEPGIGKTTLGMAIARRLAFLTGVF